MQGRFCDPLIEQLIVEIRIFREEFVKISKKNGHKKSPQRFLSQNLSHVVLLRSPQPSTDFLMRNFLKCTFNMPFGTLPGSQTTCSQNYKLAEFVFTDGKRHCFSQFLFGFEQGCS